MRIGIIGPGAMGLLFGGYLSRNNEVTLIGHDKEKAVRISQKGVTIRETDGSENVYFPACSAGSEGMEPMELVILLVKSGSSEEALEENKGIIGKNTALMTLQNGCGHEGILKKYASEDNIIIGVTNQGAYVVDEGIVCHSGGGETVLGVCAGEASRFEHIARALTESGFDCRFTENIKYTVWNKLMINGSSSVLSGLLQVRQGYIAENKHAWSVAEKLICEMCDTAAAEGCFFNKNEQLQRVKNHLKNAPGGYTSVYADIKAGRKTEVRRISGYVAETAAKYGIEAPVTNTVLSLILSLEG